MALGIGELLVIMVICAGPIFLGAVVTAVLVVRSRRTRAPCPLCRARVDRQATVCPSCGRDLPQGWSAG